MQLIFFKTVYPVNLLNQVWAAGGVFLKVFYIQAQLACKQREFYFFLYNLDVFNVLTDGTILNRHSRSRHPCLVPDLRRKVYS